MSPRKEKGGIGRVEPVLEVKVEWKVGIYRERSFLSSLVGSLDLAVHGFGGTLIWRYIGFGKRPGGSQGIRIERGD